MGLSERIDRNVDLTYFEGEIPVEYVYTYGLGLETFFRALKDKGAFTASRCPECGFVYLPCRIFCERCFARMEDTFELPGSGRVYSFTVVHRGRDGSPKEEPAVVALIEMDGADTRLVHYLVNVEPGSVEIGMPVKPVLRPQGERRGHLEDLVGFAPA